MYHFICGIKKEIKYTVFLAFHPFFASFPPLFVPERETCRYLPYHGSVVTERKSEGISFQDRPAVVVGVHADGRIRF